jgi:hypothetical protein
MLSTSATGDIYGDLGHDSKELTTDPVFPQASGP